MDDEDGQAPSMAPMVATQHNRVKRKLLAAVAELLLVSLEHLSDDQHGARESALLHVAHYDLRRFIRQEQHCRRDCENVCGREE